MTPAAMRRSALALLLIPLLCGFSTQGLFKTQGSVSIVDQAVAAAFVALADSDWGTGETDDLTSRMPDWNLTSLPVDTSSWTDVDVSACTTAALATAISSLDGSGQKLNLPSDCTITYTGTSGGGTYVTGLDHDNVEIVGDNSTIHVSFTGSLGINAASDSGLRDRGLSIGKSVSTIDSWSLDESTLTMGATTITADEAIADIYPNDIVYITFSGPTNQGATTVATRFWRRGVCAKWGSTAYGTGCDAVANNSIIIDDPLKMDLDGSDSYQMGTFSSHTLVHVERKGGGSTTDNITENFGVRGVKITHSNGDAVRDSGYTPIYFNGCFECWVMDSEPRNWGNGRIAMNAGGRYRIQGNKFLDPIWKPRCVASISSITDSVGVAVTVTLDVSGSSNDSCDTSSSRWGGGGSTETMLHFHPDVNEPLLANSTFYYTAPGGGPSSGSITLTLPDVLGTGSLETNPGGNVTNINQYNVATIYVHGGISGVEIINNAIVNTRVGIIIQGGDETIVAYNYIWTEAEEHCSRALFFHGGGVSAANLLEGNETNCGFVPYAGSNGPRDGEGPFQTWFRNRGVDTNYTAHSLSAQCDEGVICVEQTSQEGASTPFSNYIGNVFAGLSGGGGYIDDMNNDDDGGGTHESPGQLYASFWGKNLWHNSANADAYFDPSGGYGPTDNPDVDANDDNEGDSAGWSSFTFPTSLVFDSVPDWWCTESGTFPNIGADVDDMSSGSPSDLPAKILYDEGTCTSP